MYNFCFTPDRAAVRTKRSLASWLRSRNSQLRKATSSLTSCRKPSLIRRLFLASMSGTTQLNSHYYLISRPLNYSELVIPTINWIKMRFCRPYVFHDLMMSLPDFVKHFFPDLPLEKSREMLQEILKVNIIGTFGKQIVQFCSITSDKCWIEFSMQLKLLWFQVVLYKGNTGHQEVLRTEGKCGVYDPVPLVLVKDIMTYMPQMKYMFR